MKVPPFYINNNAGYRVEMNYLKAYCNLIRKAENRTPPKGYTEKHHTFPISIFGNNNRVVVLTGKEHSVAHALLEKIYLKRYGIENWKTQKMIFAYCNMKASNGYHKNRYINSRLYESSKIRRSKIMCELMSGKNNPFYGKTHSKEAIAKIKEASIIRTSITEETRIKMSESKKGKPLSKECRERCKEVNTGNTYRIGKKHSDEAKQKMKKRREGLKWWNDGKTNLMKKECPGEEWKRGRLPYKRNK